MARRYPLCRLHFEHDTLQRWQNLRNHNHYVHLSLVLAASQPSEDGKPEKALTKALEKLINGP